MHKLISRYLRREYRKFVKNIQIDNTATDNMRSPVWVCWWQGEKMMPLVPKVCIKKLRKNMRVGQELIVISEDNYDEYLQIPAYIKKNVHEGRISITNFSDIIRFGLLAKYGGLWIDATCYTTGLLPDITPMEFYSSKQDKEKDDSYVSKYRWSSYLIGGNQRGIFFNMYKLFVEYCKKEYVFVHYFLLDYFLNLVYEESEVCRQAIDNLEITEPDILVLQSKLNDEYDKDRFPEGTIHKLSWKIRFYPYTADGIKKTYWGEIIDSI